MSGRERIGIGGRFMQEYARRSSKNLKHKTYLTLMTEKVSCWELKEEVVLIMVTKIQILKILNI